MADADGYHRWVFSSFARYVSNGTVLEVGSGHGKYARMLATRASRVLVSDIDPNAVQRLKADLGDLKNVEYRVMDGIDVREIGTSLDSVVLVNVLEHIEDDSSVLRACHEAIRPGGRLIVFVPAWPLLYARMDREAGHHRRYRRVELKSKVEAAGFSLDELRFFNAVGFFGWLVNKWTRSPLNNAGTNAQIQAFNRLVPIIRQFDRALPFLGQSLLAVGTRRVEA